MKGYVLTISQCAPQTRIIRVPELLAILGVSRSTLWRWRKSNQLPEAFCMGERVVGWPSCAIESWINSENVGGVR